jgi:hypothetical protein
MKKITIYISLLILGFMSSCTNYIDEAFKNPNAPTEVSPGELLPAMTVNLAAGIQFDARFIGRYNQYWATTSSSGSWDRFGYDIGSDNGGEKWRNHYFALGQNTLYMMNAGRQEGKDEYVGAGHALFALSWLQLTDYHGEVILKQAFQRDRLTFDYDSQEDTYKQVQMHCDSADFFFNRMASKAPSADFVVADKWLYGGDIAKWKKFVAGVRAKVLHRYSLKSTYKPDDVIKNVDAALASTDDEAMVKYNNGPVSTADANFFGPRRANLPAYRPTDFFIRLLDGSVYTGIRDPRLAFLFTPSTDGVFRGVTLNLGESTTLVANRRTFNFFGQVSNAAPAVSVGDGLSRSFFKNDAKFPLMTVAELQFIKAEAAFLKGDKNTAFIAFQRGIKASFDMFTAHYTGYTAFTSAQVTSYINSVSPKSAADLTIRDIMLQKYIALWGYGFDETWVDLRRYQYSTDIYTSWNVATFFPDNNNKYAYRVRPRFNSEYLWNIDALKKIKGLDLDYHTIPMWFSQK